MAIQPMTDATSKGVASSVEYNKVTANIRDLDARLGPVVSSATAASRLTTLENKLGTGIGTTTDATTGTATAQLTDLRQRVTNVEAATGTGFVGGEVKANVVQSINGGTKLNFQVVTKTPVGITWNGSNTWTIQTDGVYAMYGNCRLANGNGAPAFHISGTTYSDDGMLFPGTSTNTGYGDIHISAIGFLTAGQQICAYAYNGSAVNTVVYTSGGLRGPMFKIWRVA